MKTLRLILALLSCFAAGAQQKDAIAFENVDDLRYYERFMIEAGARLPLDKLADKVGISPEVGFWFRSRLRNDDMLDVGFTLWAPTDMQPFSYNDRGDRYTVSPTGVSGMGGFRMNKVYPLGRGRYTTSVEWVSSFGYAFFMFRDRYSEPAQHSGTAAEEATPLKALSTFHIGQGFRFNIDNIGLQVQYNYTPYGQFSSHVPKDFGSHSFTIAVVYRQ
jgi:hypothetical protein